MLAAHDLWWLLSPAGVTNAQNNVSPLPNIYNSTNGIIYVRAINTLTGCINNLMTFNLFGNPDERGCSCQIGKARLQWPESAREVFLVLFVDLGT